MSSDRWRRLKAIVDEALDMDPGERERFLDEACADPAMRREVDSLLSHEAASFLESPPHVPGRASSSTGARPVGIGAQLAHFEIRALLGAGGMGEVYRARDTKLGREVAIKLLPESMSGDPERLARLQREAQVLASLNHAGIASIYDLGEHDSQRFLVLELVEGETLADQIARGPVPVEVALQIARQIALALEAAHGAGIVHRDLKPANVKITPEFKVVVLDFGLAKVADPAAPAAPDPTHSPTILDHDTKEGMILGTAAYMSPEQARGQPVDRRGDVWAFGCVLYEMLTGSKPFTGASVTDVLAAIVKDEPDWAALPAAVPPTARALLRRCLRKDPDRRLHDIADARIEIEEAIDEPEGFALPGEAPRGWNRMLSLQLAALLVTGAALVSGLVGWLVGGNAPGDDRPAVRASLELTDGRFEYGQGSQIVLSPDGSRIAYVTDFYPDQQVHVRRLVGASSTVLGGGTQPFFSPAGDWVGFVRNRPREVGGVELVRVPVGGGSGQVIAVAPTVRGASWGDDDTIVFGSRDEGLFRVPASGGTPEPLTEAVREQPSRWQPSHRWPHVLPGSTHLLFASRADAPLWDNARVELLDVASGERRLLVDGGTSPRYLPTGHLVYLNRGTLYAAPFDLRRLAITGSTEPVVRGVAEWNMNGSAYYSVADNGTLAYLSNHQPKYPVLRVTPAGIREEIREIPPGAYADPRLSPDGTRLAVTDWADGKRDVRVYDLRSGAASIITTYSGFDQNPVWSPDGVHLMLTSDRNREGGGYDIFRARADGSGNLEPLTAEGRRPRTTTTGSQFASDWTANAGLAFMHHVNGAYDVHVQSMKPGAEPVAIAEEPGVHEMWPAVSPNGRWVAYESERSDTREIHVRANPDAAGSAATDRQWTISSGGGMFPRWRADGRVLYYRTDEGIMAVDVETDGATFVHGRPRYLFQGPYLGGSRGIPFGGRVGLKWDYDVSADGQTFIMFPATDDDFTRRAEIVVDWFTELRRLVPADR